MPATTIDPAIAKLPPIDRLLTRPETDEPLPTALDPASPAAHGSPADPKCDEKKDPADIGRTA